MRRWFGNRPLSELANAALQGPFVGLPVAAADALRGIAAQLDERLEFFSVEQFGVRYHARMGIEGSKPAQFVDTVIRSRQGVDALAGIRFLGLDPSKPFVDLLPFRDVQTLAEVLPDLCLRALEHYAPFNPQRVRLTLSPLAHRSIARSVALEADMRTLVSRRGEEHKNTGAFWQSCDDAAAFHRVYRDAFERDLISRPHLRPHREVVGFEELRRGLDALLVGFVGDVVGNPAGFVLLEPGAVLGQSAFIVREILVLDGYRRQGYGTRLMGCTTAVASTARTDALVFASIHDSNKESLGSAFAAGFHEFVTDYFIES